MKPFLMLVDLDRPLPWDTFSFLPDDIQRDYLNRLKADDLQASSRMIAEAMGTNHETVRRRCRELGVNYKTGHVSKACLRAWETWLARKDYSADMADNAQRALQSDRFLGLHKPEVRAI